ncbi:iron-hydroxamate ABC transporter substrate-binding protein [Cohnella hashimotonis]|uniref:Iron-hydroxamate ABC transporter substrate-binding protein n=1 Tax=Cohnella hashimotonis TaxID=2826895 RepID=A0ABT6TAN6_9BACL|nr:iron-hydroxamate ABC transporter substrate-binding protein [Cohnella hashimotonis]MDI4643373.1 iron-hydroxamate ABC transporter substrate-binding protein [Cohnella hashimotonis]
MKRQAQSQSNRTALGRGLLLVALFMVAAFALAACGNNDKGSQASPAASSSAAATAGASGSASASPAASPSAEAQTGTVTYQSEAGPVEVPANPQRVIVLSGYTGDVLQLGVPLVGVDSWSLNNPKFADKLQGVTEVSDEDLEKIIELKPDLIIGSSDSKNLDKLKQIAPLVTYTYNKVDYLTQHLEIAKALNKEKEGQAWIDDFKKRAADVGEQIKAKIGADATVSVIEAYDKQVYTFGDAWGRGTEILFQLMGLNMQPKVKEATAKDGYFTLSAEVLPDYAGDYIIMSKDPGADVSFQQTATYKNIPAVKNNRVYEVDSRTFYFNDALTLEWQLEFFKEKFLGN